MLCTHTYPHYGIILATCGVAIKKPEASWPEATSSEEVNV